MGPAATLPVDRPRRGRGLAIILLAVVAAMFLVAAVALGALYVTERSAHNRTQQQVTSNRTQIDGLQKELDSTKGQLTSAEDARREQEGRAAELQKCADAANEFFASVSADDQARGERAIAAMVDSC